MKRGKTTMPALLAAAALMNRLGATVAVVGAEELRAAQQRGGIEVRPQADGSIAVLMVGREGAMNV